MLLPLRVAAGSPLTRRHFSEGQKDCRMTPQPRAFARKHAGPLLIVALEIAFVLVTNAISSADRPEFPTPPLTLDQQPRPQLQPLTRPDPLHIYARDGVSLRATLICDPEGSAFRVYDGSGRLRCIRVRQRIVMPEKDVTPEWLEWREVWVEGKLRFEQKFWRYETEQFYRLLQVKEYHPGTRLVKRIIEPMRVRSCGDEELTLFKVFQFWGHQCHTICYVDNEDTVRKQDLVEFHESKLFARGEGPREEIDPILFQDPLTADDRKLEAELRKLDQVRKHERQSATCASFSTSS